MTNPTIAVSAPGKVLLVGGYLILDRDYTGLVFGLSARINILMQEIQTSSGVQLSEIHVDSPQFLQAQWRYGYRLAEKGGGIRVIQLQIGDRQDRNPFIETTLSYALTYVSHAIHQNTQQLIKPARLTILADNDYYSRLHDHEEDDTPTTRPKSKRGHRFARFPTTLKDAHKTGLGSSAALVTALTAAVLTHYLPPGTFDVTSEQGKTTLHNLAQTAHCAAQGKVGSGFDVAAAVFGSCRYRRFSPRLVAQAPEPGSPGFAQRLDALVRGDGPETTWDVEVVKEGVQLPAGVAMRMCDVNCGSQTVGMVGKVLAWRKERPARAKELWDGLQRRNNELAETLRNGDLKAIGSGIRAVRGLMRIMGEESGTPIVPDSQMELLEALETLDGIYGGTVPGAGGHDALVLLIRDDGETSDRVQTYLRENWSKGEGTSVRLLDVKGEVEGVRMERPEIFELLA